MLVSFSVENFRSFRVEQTLSLVASSRHAGSHEGHAIAVPDSEEKVLKTAVLYGANGAGKSNLFKALKYFKSVALRPRKKNTGTGREAFRFGGASEEPSSFDLQFIVREQLYRFGFRIDDHKIVQEWLVKITGNKERVLYERATDENGRVQIEGDYLKSVNEKLSALVTVGGPQNQSFLATIRATLDEDDIGSELASIIDWFLEGLKLIDPTQSIAPLGHLLSSDPKFLTFAGTFLKSSSTGVDHLSVQKTEITEEELRAILPETVAERVIQDVSKSPHNTAVVDMAERGELLIEKTDAHHYYRISVQAAHEYAPGSVAQLDLADESDGTRRLLSLMPALNHDDDSGAVYFIDEIDRSMHPMLIWKFLQFFLESCKADRHQIIITTHESNLLDLDLLRRDEIWFVEKSATSETHIYPLTDFRVRKDLEIRKHYLQGRFGAVPFLGNLDRMLVERGNV
ncbi:AAA family ATPase [Paraburkholderia phytofirmans]|uniref:Abortive phage resistance protein-like protein n=1 Tax=Paraburkholderia phytofirmans (strain DSM 17436 / LMG 22146 / PsJN) TaxID=398527 RepID=B2T1D6_PARPJ|nr:ATP-binding protein [Paraburkholderia phytofirmans]ACD15493.1 abortive phage resistance protein-like protein [Paraburkholderia phytofirmans PsJN]